MSDIETRLFRYFVALAEEQHFGRAAVNLDISPSTLTNQIQKLEARIGARLVERRGNTHIELTDTGKRFLERARNVLREAKEAEVVARQAARGEIGRLEIGFMAVAMLNGSIEKFVGGFRRENPAIEIMLHQYITIEQINAIVSRDIDFGFVRKPDNYPIGLQGFLVARLPMMLALPADHPLARQNQVAPSDLKDVPFINYSPDLDVGFWKHMDVLGNLGHFTPNITRRGLGVFDILAYVSAGEGVAVVSHPFTHVDIPNVVYRPFNTETPPMSPMAFIYRERESSPAAMAFIKFMRRHAIPG
jgi:DNA-binding transcriptional LysR family regulator